MSQFRCGMSARIVAVTLLGVAEKYVERFCGCEFVLGRKVKVPFRRPALCGVFCHVESIGDAYSKGKQIVDWIANPHKWLQS